MEDIYVKNVYSKIASHFSDTRNGYKWNWVTDFIDKLPSNSIILDIGCGNGRNMENSKNKYFIGIDNCAEFVSICRSKNLNIINADMCDLPFIDNSFDAIISIASFHHLDNKERRVKALKEMRRVLKKDGLILMSVWSINQPTKSKRVFKNYGDTIVPWNKFGKIYERYYYIFKLDELKELFSLTNFKIKEMSWCYGNEILIIQ